MLISIQAVLRKLGSFELKGSPILIEYFGCAGVVVIFCSVACLSFKNIFVVLMLMFCVINVSGQDLSSGDAVYFNPAAVAGLGQGLHLYLSNQTIYQTRTVKASPGKDLRRSIAAGCRNPPGITDGA
jgi:hypothetical protein